MISIAMPTKSSARCISDGESMVERFEAAGYTTDLQYAEDDIPNQLAQVENMIAQEVDALVIASIDGATLTNALDIPASPFANMGFLAALAGLIFAARPSTATPKAGEGMSSTSSPPSSSAGPRCRAGSAPSWAQ